MAYEVIQEFVNDVQQATDRQALESGNLIHVSLTVSGVIKKYMLSLGPSHSVKLPINSRETIWAAVESIHEYLLSTTTDNMEHMKLQIAYVEKDVQEFSLRQRLQALLFVALTGVRFSKSVSITSEYLKPVVFDVQREVFNRVLGQIAATNNTSIWSTFVTEMIDTEFATPILKPFIRELNMRGKIPLSIRLLLSAHRDVLTLGIKSPLGDLLARTKVESIEAL